MIAPLIWIELYNRATGRQFAHPKIRRTIIVPLPPPKVIFRTRDIPIGEPKILGGNGGTRGAPPRPPMMPPRLMPFLRSIVVPLEPPPKFAIQPTRFIEF